MSCARSSNPDVQRGSTYKYRAGYPEVRFSAVGFLNEQNQPSIEIAADIVYGSLIFKEVDGSQQANIAIDVRVINQNDAEDVVESKHYEFDIENSDNNLINSQQSYIFEKRLDVPAGEYKVYFTVIDLNSDKDITRVANTGIPNPEINKIDLTDIRMLGKDVDTDSAQWLPVNTYNIPGRLDSLMFIFQATNNNSDEPLTINSQLVRFYADDSIPRPMFYNNYSRSTIEYNGILPDLFREGDGVVATGKLNDAGIVIASEVLARHDETYMPVEVADALERAEQASASSQSNATGYDSSNYGY
jgi:hypothetical protein